MCPGSVQSGRADGLLGLAEQPDTQGETSAPQSCQGRVRPNDSELLESGV